jgi:hypothetical protein
MKLRSIGEQVRVVSPGECAEDRLALSDDEGLNIAFDTSWR